MMVLREHSLWVEYQEWLVFVSNQSVFIYEVTATRTSPLTVTVRIKTVTPPLIAGSTRFCISLIPDLFCAPTNLLRRFNFSFSHSPK